MFTPAECHQPIFFITSPKNGDCTRRQRRSVFRSTKILLRSETQVRNLSKGRILFVMFAALMAAVPAASAATCSNASINGVYGVLSSGLNGSGQPASSVDRVSVNGAGSLSGSSSKSIDGQIVTYTFTGTYTINKNCTGNATFNKPGRIHQARKYLLEQRQQGRVSHPDR